MTNNQTYYIKDNLIYSKNTSKYNLPRNYENILAIPDETKNHLTNNKIVINQLEKIKENHTREVELGEAIKDFKETKTKIETAKKEASPTNITFKKPQDDDYNFIEKTSQLEIIENILLQHENKQDFNDFKEKIQQYIKHAKTEEQKKNSQIDEQIDIETNKKYKQNEEKDKFINNHIKPIENKIKNLKQKLEKLKKEKETANENLTKSLQRPKTKNTQKLYENLQKEEEIKQNINNLKHDIKILKAKVQSIKDDMRLGTKYCVNIWLAILTLGFIYYTKYATCKNKILRTKKKANKKNQKILMLEQKLYNLGIENEKLQKEENKNNQIKTKNTDEIQTKLDELEQEIEKTKNEIKNEEKLQTQQEKDLDKFDNQITKITNKIIELESTKEEFEKHSTKAIQEIFDEIRETKEKNIQKLKELKTNIQNQKTEIKGDWIVEINE